MTNKILIAGFACLSVIAVAQSSGSKDQSASAAQGKDQHPKEVASGQASGKTVAPRDIATGQASGKTASKPAGSQAVLSDPTSSQQVTAPRDLATGQASGKRQYQPVVIMKVQDKATPLATEQQSPGKVMASDDWQAKAKTSGNTHVSPADMNQDGAADRESPSTSRPKGQQARVATGDVSGDGKADAAINTSHSNIKNTKDTASGQMTGKRQHQPLTVTKEVGAAPQK